MMRIIAVDDEQPALRRVGKLLQGMKNVQVVGLFDSPKRFLEHMFTAPDLVDLVLLDIEMPGMNGVELARKLREICPAVHIVFLTAYEEYAREAFDVEALDYLLKPVTEADIARALHRFEKRNGLGVTAEPKAAKPRFAIQSFGPFSVTTDKGEPVRFRNSKGRELLAYLHHFGEKPVSKAQILDSLWPDGDVERTQVNLHSTVYQLRKDLEAFGLQGILEQMKTAGGSYCLRWNAAVSDDAAEFEEACRQYAATKSLSCLIKAIQLYGDGFLAGSGYAWAAPRQAELELRYITMLEALVDNYVKLSRYELALNFIQKLVHLLPLEERQHARLAALLILLNRAEDAREYCKLMIDLLDDSDSGLVMLDYSRLLGNPMSVF